MLGVPFLVNDQLFNCAAVIHHGELLGLVPKSHLPNYKEFYDARYFAAACKAASGSVTLASGESVPFGTDLLFTAAGEPPSVRPEKRFPRTSGGATCRTREGMMRG